MTLETPGRLSDGIYHPHLLRRKLCRRSRPDAPFARKGFRFPRALAEFTTPRTPLPTLPEPLFVPPDCSARLMSYRVRATLACLRGLSRCTIRVRVSHEHSLTHVWCGQAIGRRSRCGKGHTCRPRVKASKSMHSRFDFAILVGKPGTETLLVHCRELPVAMGPGT